MSDEVSSVAADEPTANKTSNPPDTFGSLRQRSTSRSLLLTGFILGVGIAGSLDEILVHQLLQWHKFYWTSSPSVGTFSDGVFHLFTVALLLWGAYRLWRYRPEWTDRWRAWALAAILIGVGAFNLYDGLVQHLVFHWHLVNEFVCPSPYANNSILTCPADLPYEFGWIAVALVVLAVGLLWRRTQQRQARR
jgi:uncharacterized membrane protein